MANFMISYLGGEHPTTPEEGQKHFAQYQAWLKSMSEHIVSPANPLKNTCSISPDGTVSKQSSTQMSGYTIIQAEDIEQAISIAKECPFLAINGTLEVSEMIEMKI